MATMKVQYLAGPLESEIKARTFPDEGVGGTARLMADRYVAMCSLALPYFAVDEWSAICSELMPTDDEGNRPDREFASALRSKVASGGVTVSSPEGFRQRLANMPALSDFAVRDFAERYWASECKLGLPGAL